MTSRSSLTVYSIKNTLWMTFTGCRLHSEKWGTSSFHIIVHICIFSGKLHGVFVNFQLCFANVCAEAQLVSPLSVFTVDVDTLSCDVWCGLSYLLWCFICLSLCAVSLRRRITGGKCPEWFKYQIYQMGTDGGRGEEWAPPPSMGPGGCIVSGSLSVTVSL